MEKLYAGGRRELLKQKNEGLKTPQKVRRSFAKMVLHWLSGLFQNDHFDSLFVRKSAK